MKPDAAPFDIARLDPGDADTAAGMHAVLCAAHTQEARWLGIAHTAPTPPSLNALQSSALFHLGALQQGRIVGVLVLGPGEVDASPWCITTLVVHPGAQRQGIARGLVQAVVQREQGMAFNVTAATANEPAMRLYTSLGFEPWRTGVLGPAQLPVTQLLLRPRGAGPGPGLEPAPAAAPAVTSESSTPQR